MKLEKLPSIHQNLNVALSECVFVHLVKEEVIGQGTIVRALNSDSLEALYLHTGEDEKDTRRVSLNVDHLHYDGETRTGFVFGPMVHDYTELPK